MTLPPLVDAAWVQEHLGDVAEWDEEEELISVGDADLVGVA